MGVLQQAEAVEEIKEFATMNGQVLKDELSIEQNEVIDKMVKDLPGELTGEQREQVREVLIENRNIISTNEYDIGRTDLVEHHIDTGDNRPIRQPPVSYTHLTLPTKRIV